MVRLPKLPLSMTASVSWTPASVGVVASMAPVTGDPSRTCRVRTCDVRANTSAGCRSSIEADDGLCCRPPLPRTGVLEVARTRVCASGYLIFGCELYEEGEQSGWVTPPDELSAQAESLDDRPVTVDVGLREVVQKAATLADQQQQPSAAVVVVLVVAKVLGEVADPLRQQRDLHLGRAGVAVGGAVLGDDLLLDILGQGHGRLLVCRCRR